MKDNLLTTILIVFVFSLLFSNAYSWEKRVEWLREINNIELNGGQDG